MQPGNYAKEFSTVEELDKFLKGAVGDPLIHAIEVPGHYTVNKCGTRRKITGETGDGELIIEDVYYAIGWEVDSE